TMLGLALLFPLLLDSGRARWRRLGRTAIRLPYAAAAVVPSPLSGFPYLPATSPAHCLAEAAGGSLPDVRSPQRGLLAIANIGIWGGTGFNMVVLYTSLRSVPRELYEAATLDGCSELQTAVRVKVPMILPSLIMTCV